MKVRIKPKPDKRQQEMIHEECRKEFYKLLGHYNRSAAIQILYILHFEFGFGDKRLEKFSDLLATTKNTELITVTEKRRNCCFSEK